jgi:hypothetical protein
MAEGERTGVRPLKHPGVRPHSSTSRHFALLGDLIPRYDKTVSVPLPVIGLKSSSPE